MQHTCLKCPLFPVHALCFLSPDLADSKECYMQHTRASAPPPVVVCKDTLLSSPPRLLSSHPTWCRPFASQYNASAW